MAVEGSAKTGVYANRQSQSQGAIIDPTGTGSAVRYARSSSGVALAPNQWDFSTATNDAGTTLVPNGGVFLNGANLGLEARR